MAEEEMKPTMRLRWAQKIQPGVKYPAITIGGTNIGQELQQWFEDDEGQGEWRTVPLEAE